MTDTNEKYIGISDHNEAMALIHSHLEIKDPDHEAFYDGFVSTVKDIMSDDEKRKPDDFVILYVQWYRDIQPNLSDQEYADQVSKDLADSGLPNAGGTVHPHPEGDEAFLAILTPSAMIASNCYVIEFGTLHDLLDFLAKASNEEGLPLSLISILLGNLAKEGVASIHGRVGNFKLTLFPKSQEDLVECFLESQNLTPVPPPRCEACDDDNKTTH